MDERVLTILWKNQGGGGLFSGDTSKHALRAEKGEKLWTVNKNLGRKESQKIWFAAGLFCERS